MYGKILTLPDVVQLLMVSENTAFTKTQKSQLPPLKAPKHWRFKRVDINHWMQMQSAAADIGVTKEGDA